MVESSIRLLADEHISPRFAEILEKLGERNLSSIIGTSYKGKPDHEWIPAATSEDYIVLTCDSKMLERRLIVQALLDTKARFVFLPHQFADSRRYEQCLWLLKHYRKIRDHCGTLEPGQCCSVSHRGKIEPIIPGVPSRNRKQRRR